MVIRVDRARRRCESPGSFLLTAPRFLISVNRFEELAVDAANVFAAASSPIATPAPHAYFLYPCIPTPRSSSAWNLNKATSLAKRPRQPAAFSEQIGRVPLPGDSLSHLPSLRTISAQPPTFKDVFWGVLSSGWGKGEVFYGRELGG